MWTTNYNLLFLFLDMIINQKGQKYHIYNHHLAIIYRQLAELVLIKRLETDQFRCTFFFLFLYKKEIVVLESYIFTTLEE